MPDVTLTDQELARTLVPLCAHGDEPCSICDQYRGKIIAALRASREQLAKIGEWAHPDGIDAECYLCGETHGNGAPTDATCPCPAHDAALGEEAT